MSTRRKSRNQEKWIIFRYGIVVMLFILLGIAVVVNIIKIAVVEKDIWKEIARKEKNQIPDSRINPERGNILSSDGRLMATSFPRYHIYMDFQRAKDKNGKIPFDTAAFLQVIIPSKKKQKPTSADTLRALSNGIDSLTIRLADKLKRDRRQLKEELLQAYRTQSRRYRITDERIEYFDLNEIKNYPFFRLGNTRSGMISEEYIERRNPYVSLAARTVGDVYATLDTAGYSQGKNGLELRYNTYLRGEAGLKSTHKIGGRWINTPVREAIRGMDVITTIDIEIQYVTEKALRNIMQQTQAQSGTAIVMEVKTGQIKAISNLGRTAEGYYSEDKNYAVADQIEPGSTFKTASIIVALDDEVCTPDDMVDTGNGAFLYKGRLITDYNRDRGGNHNITVAEAMHRSSNIGISKIILKGYEKDPKKFVDGLARLGFNDNLNLEIPGAGKPIIRTPDEKKWSPSDLPSMAYGYVTSIPPIYMLAFYNAIANNGKMMRPYFVREIQSEGKTIHSYEPTVVREAICTKSTLNSVRDMLLGVVEDEHGTGKPAKSTIVRIAGKTGTALISENGGYAGNGKQVSFAGYFPADKPEYTCIVVVRRPQSGVTSGGGTGGRTVREIAEAIYALRKPIDVRKIKTDPAASPSPLPETKAGDARALKYILGSLDISLARSKNTTEWVSATADEARQLRLNDISTPPGLVPRVIGMGAKDAIYLLESSGLHVRLGGTGTVTAQSIEPGRKIVKGETVTLTLK